MINWSSGNDEVSGQVGLGIYRTTHASGLPRGSIQDNIQNPALQQQLSPRMCAALPAPCLSILLFFLYMWPNKQRATRRSGAFELKLILDW